MQYTLRNIPRHLDRALRDQARRDGKSLNTTVLEMLLRSLGLLGDPPPQRDLSDIVGSWHGTPTMNQVLRDQRRIDPELWR